MGTINALGFIEVYGLVAGIEAADAMLKSARVRLLRHYEVHPGLITVAVEGDLAACQAAVNAGVAAASRIGKVVSNLVIPRPDGDTETLVLDLITRQGHGKGTGEKSSAVPAKQQTAHPSPAAETKSEAKPTQAASVPKKAPAKAPVQKKTGNRRRKATRE